MDGRKDIIKYKIVTQSNLFIGGAPAPFEIGGIDQYTVTDQNGYPYIPASSMKGALRNIIREDGSSDEAKGISNLYSNYLEKLKKEYQLFIEKMAKEDSEWAKEEIQQEKREGFEKRYQKVAGDKTRSKTEYIFGIEGFNNTPRLLFSDLILSEESREKGNCFSIDMKNSISMEKEKPEANPRSYKTARRGLTFEGTIRLYKISELAREQDVENVEELCTKHVCNSLCKFNDGIHRLGNSKSRGYGKIQVLVWEPSEKRYK